MFFKPAPQRWEYSADPLCVWRQLVDPFETVTVPGDHVTMCTDHADTLAAALDRYIETKLAV